MHEEIIKAQKHNSLTTNYNKWIFDNISPYIGSSVLDVGSGSGNFLGYLLDKESIVIIDILDFFIDELRKTYGSNKNIHIFKYDIQDEEIVQAAGSYDIDTVICNNVLEHVQDDLKALNNINKILNGSGRLILVLPAFQFLYSKWDKAVGHFRRYDFNDIRKKLRETGFNIQVKFYMNSMGVFAWFLNGKVLKNTPNTGFLIEEQAVFFDRHIVKLIRKIEAVLPPLFGQSLIIIAKPSG